MSRVAAQLHLPGAFVSIEVAKLVKADLVEKRINAAGCRRVLLSTTVKGPDLRKGLAPMQSKLNGTLFDCLTAEDFHALRGMISKLVDCGDKALLLLEILDHEKAASKKSVRVPAASEAPKSYASRKSAAGQAPAKRARAARHGTPGVDCKFFSLEFQKAKKGGDPMDFKLGRLILVRC